MLHCKKPKFNFFIGSCSWTLTNISTDTTISMHIDIGIMRLIKFSAAYRIFSLWCSSSSFRFSSNQKNVNRKLYRPTYNKCRFLMAVNLSFTIFFFFLLFFLARSCFFARTASFLARTTFAFLKSKFNLI